MIYQFDKATNARHAANRVPIGDALAKFPYVETN